jgi:hypothetical protein
MSDFYSEAPDAVFLLAAASRLEAVHRTQGLVLDSLATIVRLYGRERARILRGITNGWHDGRAMDWRSIPGLIRPCISRCKRRLREGDCLALKLLDPEAGDQAEVAEIDG